ncbi:MAG: hypothetical protein WAT36_08585 [Chromatiaceae bacterium]
MADLGLTEVPGQGGLEACLPAGYPAGGTRAQEGLFAGLVESRKVITRAGPDQTGLADEEFLHDLADTPATPRPAGLLGHRVQAPVQAFPGGKTPEVS